MCQERSHFRRDVARLDVAVTLPRLSQPLRRILPSPPRIAILTAAASLLFASSLAQAAARASLEAEAAALEMRWAPVLVQSVSADHPERDRPLPVDFDGDWDATNNWRNSTPEHRSTRAAVYGAAILSESHAYLTYTLFFPRDWATPACVSLVCHDNDLETLLVVVERPSEARPHGKLVLVESKAHRGFPWAVGSAVALDPAGHPLFSVESEGHGIYPILDEPPPDPRSSVRFVPPEHPAEPARGTESYALLSLHETLWARRSQAAAGGKAWIEGLAYSGARLGRRGEALGIAMAHAEYRGGVRPPWGVEAAPGARGDWFLDPAFVAAERHPEVMRSSGTVSTRYALNPFLDDLAAECAGDACRAAPNQPSGSSWRWSGLGAAVAIGVISSRLSRRLGRGPRS